MKKDKIKIKIFDTEKTHYFGRIKLKKEILGLDIWIQDFLFKKERRYYLEIVRKKIEKVLQEKVSCVWIRKDEKENFTIEIFSPDEQGKIVQSHMATFHYSQKEKEKENDAPGNSKFVRTK